MKFPTMYDRMHKHEIEESFFSDPGDRMKACYHPVYDEKGVWHLEEDDPEDLYLEIQSHKDSCDINVLLARYNNGETDVLQKIQGVYADVTQFPDNFAEVMNSVMAGENLFNSLPVDIREKFNQDFVQFMASAGSDEWFDALGLTRKPDPVPAGDEPKEDTKE